MMQVSREVVVPSTSSIIARHCLVVTELRMRTMARYIENIPQIFLIPRAKQAFESIKCVQSTLRLVSYEASE